MNRSAPATTLVPAARLAPTASRALVAVVAIAVAVSVAQLADLMTFRAMVDVYGLHAEANPFAAHAAGMLGLDAMAVAKALLIGFVVLVYALLFRGRGRVGSLVATIAVVAGVIGTWSNLVVLRAI